MAVSPASGLIKLEQLKKREVPIQVVTEGDLPLGLTLKSLTPIPPTVTIKGAESKVDALSEVPSVPLKLSEIHGSQERDLPLDLLRMGIQLEGSVPKVRVELEGHGANFKIKNIPVRVETSLRFKADPDTVTVLVNANPTDLKKLNRSKVYATVDMTNKQAGDYNMTPSVVLPPNVSLIRTIPEQIKLKLY
jgi:YbbR domain-containing protein